MDLLLSNHTVTNIDPVDKTIGQFPVIDLAEINPKRFSDNFNWTLADDSEEYLRLNRSHLVLAKNLRDCPDTNKDVAVRC